MSDDRNPVEAALDLVFYAPLGLAITAAEEVPKLAAKGRKRFSGQWATARVVGQFAVAQGRKQAADRFSRPTPAPARPTVVAAPVGRTRPEPAAEAAPKPAPTPAPKPAPTPKPAPAPTPAPGGVPAADALAIPDYDSLSASQVVQRLAGLATAELDAVGRYEAGTRGRRTILSRVAQLQAG